MTIPLQSSSKLLFIGDSITDCGRRDDAELLGHGYVRTIRDYLAATHRASVPAIINRGISGNKIPDLQTRWDRDVIGIAPDILSIYIGINDVWHSFAPGGAGCTINDYISGYRDILTRTRKQLPACKVVLCEPSVIWIDQPKDANERIKPYADAVQKIAGEFGIEHVVPLYQTFNTAKKLREDIALTNDGVHPTSAGHMLIAMTWMKTVGCQ